MLELAWQVIEPRVGLLVACLVDVCIKIGSLVWCRSFAYAGEAGVLEEADRRLSAGDWPTVCGMVLAETC